MTSSDLHFAPELKPAVLMGSESAANHTTCNLDAVACRSTAIQLRLDFHLYIFIGEAIQPITAGSTDSVPLASHGFMGEQEQR